MMKNLPKVSIIIVNFNGERFIEKCLSSLKNLNYPQSKLEIVVIDNGSKDSSLNIIKDKFPKVKIIPNEVNNYCKANNIGIQNSTGDLIAFLNNDTEVDKDWLIELVKVIQTNKRIGAVGSKLIFPNGLLNSVGQKEHTSFYFKDEGFKEEDKGQYDRIKEIESLCGCSILYKKACIKDIGLFDEDLIMYCEDVDMAIRCKSKKWKLYYVPKSKVKHEYNGTGSLDLQEEWVERNRLLLLAKHHPDKLPFLMFSSAYFQKNDEIFKIIPDVIKKIIDTHGFEKFDSISKDFFSAMKNYFYSKKDYLIKSFEIEREMFKESKKRLRQTNKKFEKELKIIRKDNKTLLDLKEKELDNLKKELDSLKKELDRLYNSKGYKWVLSNIWAISNKLKKSKKCQ